MANKRKLAKKAKLKKNKDRLVLYHASNNNVESSASESFSGESVDGRHNEIIQEENDVDDHEMDIKNQCVSTLSLLHWIIIVTLLHYI